MRDISFWVKPHEPTTLPCTTPISPALRLGIPNPKAEKQLNTNTTIF